MKIEFGMFFITMILFLVNLISPGANITISRIDLEDCTYETARTRI
jgi:hypothetical protein